MQLSTEGCQKKDATQGLRKTDTRGARSDGLTFFGAGPFLDRTHLNAPMARWFRERKKKAAQGFRLPNNDAPALRSGTPHRGAKGPSLSSGGTLPKPRGQFPLRR